MAGLSFKPRWLFPILILTTSTIGATSCAASASSSAPVNLTVAAAADAQPALEGIGSIFERETGARVAFSFGSSGNLATQIENGAPVDVFASADDGYVGRLAGQGLTIQGTDQLYALGRLALVSYKGGAIRVGNLSDLASQEVTHVSLANPDHAPYGMAAKQALEAAGVWDRIARKVVYGENVRQALQFVETGNAEAGIVALSIADVPGVSSVPVDPSLHRPLRQSIVVLKGTREERLARDFVAFVNGPKGRPILDKYGLTLR